jgi:two-component system response regulator LytT
MSKLTIFVLEDDPLIAESIKMNLMELGHTVLEPASSKEEALDVLKSSKIDFAILDINIEGEQVGIVIGDYIDKFMNIPFIYLTANSDRDSINKASKTHPQSYLIKPFTTNDLYSAVQIAISNINDKNESFEISEETKLLPDSVFIKVGNKHIKTKIEDVLYIKSSDKYIEIVTILGTYHVRSNMEAILNILKGNKFLRVHRSYVINLLHLKEIKGENISINDFQIPIGRIYRVDLLKTILTLQ